MSFRELCDGPLWLTVRRPGGQAPAPGPGRASPSARPWDQESPCPAECARLAAWPPSAAHTECHSVTSLPCPSPGSEPAHTLWPCHAVSFDVETGGRRPLASVSRAVSRWAGHFLNQTRPRKAKTSPRLIASHIVRENPSEEASDTADPRRRVCGRGGVGWGGCCHWGGIARCRPAGQTIDVWNLGTQKIPDSHTVRADGRPKYR